MQYYSSRQVLNLLVLTLSACQDPNTGLESGDSSPLAAATSNTWQKRIQMPTDRRWVMTATVEPASGGSFAQTETLSWTLSLHHATLVYR